jgi:hypothetical protein
VQKTRETSALKQPNGVARAPGPLADAQHQAAAGAQRRYLAGLAKAGPQAPKAGAAAGPADAEDEVALLEAGSGESQGEGGFSTSEDADATVAA